MYSTTNRNYVVKYWGSRYRIHTHRTNKTFVTSICSAPTMAKGPQVKVQ